MDEHDHLGRAEDKKWDIDDLADEIDRLRAECAEESMRRATAETRLAEAEQTLADERDKSYIRGKAVMAHKILALLTADFDWAVGELGEDWPDDSSPGKAE